MSIKDNLFQEVNEHEVLHVEIEGDDERVVEMCRLYWQCDKNLKFFPMVSHIAAHMGTNVAKLTQVVKAHSFAFLTDDPCPACGGMQTYKTRIEVTERSATWACEDCTTDAKERALAAKRLLQQRQREQINSTFAIEDNPLNFEQETLENCVLLLSYIRLASLEDEDFFLSVVQLPQSLCPSHKYSVEAVTQLCRAGLICVHPSSPLDAFEFDAHGNLTGSYDESKVFWTLPVGGDQERARTCVDHLESIFRNMEWPDSWHKETTLLWKKIAYSA